MSFAEGLSARTNAPIGNILAGDRRGYGFVSLQIEQAIVESKAKQSTILEWSMREPVAVRLPSRDMASPAVPRNLQDF